MLKVKYNINGGELERLVNLTPDVMTTSLGITRRVDYLLVKDVSKIFDSPEEAAENFIETMEKELMQEIINYLTEGTQYINETEAVYHVTMYCKRIERNEIDCLTKEDRKEMQKELSEFFRKHWEWHEAQFNDKEFMKEQNNK